MLEKIFSPHFIKITHSLTDVFESKLSRITQIIIIFMGAGVICDPILPIFCTQLKYIQDNAFISFF